MHRQGVARESRAGQASAGDDKSVRPQGLLYRGDSRCGSPGAPSLQGGSPRRQVPPGAALQMRQADRRSR